MRELLIAFVVALVVGSIINGIRLNTSNDKASANGNAHEGENSSTQEVSTNAPQEVNASSPRRDFPDFATFASVTSDNFDDLVLKSQKPVFVDCYVPNNTACDQMIPLVAAVGKNHEDSVVMAKLNVMDNILLAHRFEVSSVPTFMVFERGELKGKLTGVLPQARLESLMAPTKNEER